MFSFLHKNKYKTSFIQKHEFSNWLASFSFSVWNRLKLLSETNNTLGKCSEPTLTENLVYGILELMREDKIPIPVRLYHSPKENTYGSDIEIVVQLAKNKNIIFPCQAKKLNVEAWKDNLKARYNAFNHNDGQQKIKLIDYAKKIEGFPIYMLYNYSEYEFKHNYSDNQLYGCSLISAIHLKDTPLGEKKPRFQDLHPTAKPLRTIMDLKKISDLKSFYGSTNTHHALTKTDKQIFGDKKWKDNELGSPEYHRFHSVYNAKELLEGNIANYENAEPRSSDLDNDLPFSPKFRIVLTNDAIDLNKRNTKSFKL